MITGLLLAAGAGTRFGGDKLLATLPDGRPLARAAAVALLDSLEDVVAVVRPDDSVLAEVLSAAGCRVIHCSQAREGMSASLGCGIRASRDASGWVVGLADMPRIRRETVAEVAGRLAGGAAIVAPAYQGQRGHPVGFASEFGDALVALTGDTGARVLLREHANSLQLIETDDPGVLLDVDTPAELAALAS